MVKNAWIIIQARQNSERLPGKVMKMIGAKPLLGYLIDRIENCGIPIIIATSVNQENDIIESFCKERGIECYRGEENNVLERYYRAATLVKAEVIFRLTADNPFLEARLLNEMLEKYYDLNSNRIYIATGISKTFPLGISAELFSYELLEEAYRNCSTSAESEHVTIYMHQNIPEDIKIVKFDGKMDKFKYRLTVDTSEDFNLIEKLIEDYKANELCIAEIIEILDKNPQLSRINEKIQQKEI